MDPLITGSLISGGANLLGGLFGRSEASKARRANNKLYKQQMAQAQGQFDAQMDQSIQRRVKDAVAAGVHPLFALGGSAGASPTISGGQPPEQDTGNAMGNAVANIGQIMGAIPTAQAQIKRDEAEAAFLNAQAAKVTQDMNSQGRDSYGTAKTYPLAENPLLPSGEPVYYQPEIPKHQPGEPHVVAGTRPGSIRIKTPDGRTVDNFDPDLGLDEIGQINYAYQRAVHKTSDLMHGTDQAIRKWFRRTAEQVKKTRAGWRKRRENYNRR